MTRPRWSCIKQRKSLKYKKVNQKLLSVHLNTYITSQTVMSTTEAASAVVGVDDVDLVGVTDGELIADWHAGADATAPPNPVL